MGYVYLHKDNMKKNPFIDCSLGELAEAYSYFDDINDHEAMEWVREVWVSKLKLDVSFVN